MYFDLMVLENVISLLIFTLGLYFLLGFLFAIAFVAKGVYIVDPATKGSSKIFKLMIFPGSVGLWPVLLKKWIKAK